jgi:hypothetical protein
MDYGMFASKVLAPTIIGSLQPLQSSLGSEQAKYRIKKLRDDATSLLVRA